MKKSTTILWFVASILMIAAGIVCFALPVGTSIRVFSYIVGALVLCMGIVELVMFFTSAGIVGGGMFLADGIITTLLGIFFLANVNVVEAILPIVFAMWFIYEGISELVLAIQAGKFQVPNWWVLLIFAIIEIIFGFVALFDPISSAISLTVLVGIFLFVRGLSMLGDWIVALRVKNFAKNWFGKAASAFRNDFDDQRVDDNIDRQ
mgnify:FL=1